MRERQPLLWEGVLLMPRHRRRSKEECGKHWRKMGKLFGYRECCIEYFCDFYPEPPGRTLLNQGKTHQVVRGGPILCEACGETRKNGEFKPEEYFVNRQVPFPVPSSSSSKESPSGSSTS